VQIDLASSEFIVAFDNSGGYFTGVAIANTDPTNPATVLVSFHDYSGAQIDHGTVAQLKPYGHTSLLLNQSFPDTKTKEARPCSPA